MQHPHSWTTLVTVAALLLYFAFSIRVALMRKKHNVPAPAMTGDPELERARRVHGNTLEYLPIFVPALWLFSIYWNDRLAALIGVVWIAGRILYAACYWAGKNRGPGFGIQALATFVLLFGAAAGAVRALMVTGGV
jgi:glutathione S-transferase